ncbi:ANTH domain-containing protein [Gorgonomyces haynaldii]|nr:ANTH domain-containing protein [Gorgonomyces haynaldii]
MSYRRNEKAEEELALAIKKALAQDESAPKQKHVRSTILYTWDVQGPGSFFTAIKSFPLLGDEVVSFKALIVFHKVVRQGHPLALKEGIANKSWLDQLTRQVSSFAGSNYSALIRGYSEYLKAKLEFHARYPAFSGTFDYEEYVSLRGVDDPDEGFETIHDLLQLLGKLDSFQKLLFSNLRAVGNNEARISALVPLVEESHGLYQFVVSMMSAMHQIIGSVEVLAPLRQKFNQSHYQLLQFYEDCNGLRYLTSLIAIPKLSHDAPDFLGQGQPTKQPKKRSDDESKRMLKQQEDEFRRMQEQELEMQRLEEERLMEERRKMEMEAQRRSEFEMMQRQEQERFRLQQQQQEQQLYQSRLMDATSQLEYLRNQHLQDRSLLEQYNMKVQQLEQQLSHLSMQSQQTLSKDDQIKRLEQEIEQWKQKYDALAKLYAQLRKEHLDLLQKYKQFKDQGTKQTDDARKIVDQSKQELQKKQDELMQVILERNRLQDNTDRIRLQYEQELQRLKLEIEQSKQALTEISSSKGAEVQSLVSRFTAEQAHLESLMQQKLQEISRLQSQISELVAKSEVEKRMHQEEQSVLQASLDQALLVLADYQKETNQGMGQRDVRITELENAHKQLLNQMMDNVLDTCVKQVQDALFVFESPQESSQKPSAQFVLSLIEKAQQSCSEFSNSFVKLVQGGDPKDAISYSSQLAQSVGQLLTLGKEAYLLAQEDEEADEIASGLRDGGLATIDFFNQVKSTTLMFVEFQKRPEHVINYTRQTQHQIQKVSPLLEKLVQSKSHLEGDLSQLVEREMYNAAKAIEEATLRLQVLISQPRQINVHTAILQAAMALMTSISHLIQCATASQQEIVNQGKHTTPAAFYKKNNKWTDGLISAAQAVASCTTLLVETADGLVQGTSSWEQLVVAAQEVSVATTQLVAASRVKAVQYSKTQDRLESAAQSVREAVKLLVKAAKDAAKLQSESLAREQVQSMSKHEAKVKEMEQQVKILQLEKELQTARYQLGEMRKQGYHAE